MAKRILISGVVTVGLCGFVMASQWGYAAEPRAYPVPATLELMQLVRDEHLSPTWSGRSSARSEIGTQSKGRQSMPRRALLVQLPYRAPRVAAETAEEVSR